VPNAAGPAEPIKFVGNDGIKSASPNIAHEPVQPLPAELGTRRYVGVFFDVSQSAALAVIAEFYGLAVGGLFARRDTKVYGQFS